MSTPLGSHPDGLSSGHVPFTPAGHRGLLLREFQVSVRLRFVIAGLLVGGSWLAAAFDPSWAARAPLLSLLGLVVAGYNGILVALQRRYREGFGSSPRRDPILILHYASVVLDVVALATVVALLGGARSPFMAVYFVHLTLSCFLYPPRSAWMVVVLIVILAATQVLLETTGRAPFQTYLTGGAVTGPLPPRLGLEVMAVYALVPLTLAGLLIPTARWIRRTQVTLEEQRDALAEHSRLRRDFLRLAVHNLRSPVAASLMHIDNMVAGRGGRLTETQLRWAERIRQRLTGLLDTLEGLQTLGLTEVADLQAYVEPVDVPEVLRSLSGEYGGQAGARGLELVIQAPPDLPKAAGIPVLIREAVANYLTNAIKYARAPGRAILRCSAVGTGRDRRVRIEVEDQGPGIPEVDRGRLFHEFVRLPSPAGDEGAAPGVGLGLSLVRRIAQVHRGAAGMTPSAEGGSLFWVEFPAWPGAPPRS